MKISGKLKFSIISDADSEIKTLTVWESKNNISVELDKSECALLAGMLTGQLSCKSESPYHVLEGSSFSCSTKQIEQPKSIRRGKVCGKRKPRK